MYEGHGEDGEHKEDGKHKEGGKHEDGEHEDGEHEDGEHEDGEDEDGEDETEKDRLRSYRNNDDPGSQKRVGLEDLLGSPGPERDKKLKRMRADREKSQRLRDEVRGRVPEENEEALSVSPMHGARPKLQGVPLYR